MSQKKKNNIIIGVLCAVVLLMVVGYAAFSSILNIKGTSSIGSNWDIAITAIDEKNIVGGATTATKENGDKKIEGIGTLTASFETNLVSPGDSIEYDITVTNRGSLDAKLDKITLSEPNSEAIIFTTSGLTEGTTLPANNGTAVLTVKVEYSNAVTSQPDKTIGNLTVTLDYLQDDGSGITPGGNTASDMLIAKVTDSGDGLYVDEYEPGRYVYKGTNPNNYIIFNNELWRIISIENDGKLRIMRNESIGNMAFDSQGARTTGYCALDDAPKFGCQVWQITDNFVNDIYSGDVDQDATLNTYLNKTYYSSLNVESQSQIVDGIFDTGIVNYDNNSIDSQITSEKKEIWIGKIGLLNVSQVLRANTNQNKCATHYLNQLNNEICKTTNYLFQSSHLWTLSPNNEGTRGVYIIFNVGLLSAGNANGSAGVAPVTHLKSDITLSGNGTITEPYVIN